MTATIRIGVVGCGVVARLHLDRLLADPRVAVAALADPNVDAARALAATTPGAEVFAEAANLIEQAPIDAVILCSPTQSHYEQAKQAIARGLSVLCEKPLVTRREEIDDLIARARAADKLLAVSYQRRYLAPYLTARRELTANADWYGPAQEIHVFVCERWRQTIVGTWRDDPAVGAGYFGDAGSHQIDICFYVTGLTPVRVWAESDRRGAKVEIVTRVSAELTDGVRLYAHFVGDAHHWREDIHFHCRDGDLLLRNEELLRAKDNVVEAIRDLEPASSPDRAFVDALLGGAPILSPAESAYPLYDWTAAVLAAIAERRSS